MVSQDCRMYKKKKHWLASNYRMRILTHHCRIGQKFSKDRQKDRNFQKTSRGMKKANFLAFLLKLLKKLFWRRMVLDLEWPTSLKRYHTNDLIKGDKKYTIINKKCHLQTYWQVNDMQSNAKSNVYSFIPRANCVWDILPQWGNACHQSRY